MLHELLGMAIEAILVQKVELVSKAGAVKGHVLLIEVFVLIFNDDLLEDLMAARYV